MRRRMFLRGPVLIIAPVLLAMIITLVIAGGASAQNAAGNFKQGRAAEIGVLLVAHGDPQAPLWNQLVEEAAASLNGAYNVDLGFQMPWNMQEPVDRLVARGAKTIIVVPVSISSYSSSYRDLEYAFGFRSTPPTFYGGAPRHMGQPYWPVQTTAKFVMTKAMDDSTIIAQVLRERARALSTEPGNETLFILAHGPVTDADNDMWIENMTRLGGYIQQRDKYADVKVGTFRIDGGEALRERSINEIRTQIQAAIDAGRTPIVVPLLVSDGHTNRHQYPQFLNGVNYAYDGTTLLPHKWVAKWVKHQVMEAFPGLKEADG